MPVIAPSMTLPRAADMTDPHAFGEPAETVMLITATDPEPFLAFVARLRDMTARGHPVCWRARVQGDVDLRPLFHLYPPVAAGDAGQVRSWRDSFGLGLRHYRRGPGFVIVYDNRHGTRPRQFLLTSADEIAWFDRLHDPGAPSPDEPAVSRLRDAGLLFGLGGKYVMPVCRLRRLPLPTHLI